MMRLTGRIAGGVAVVGLVGALVAYALPGDTNADLVLGQPDFTTTGFSTTASTFTAPVDVVVDGDGNVYVSDSNNNRVLGWPAASLANGASASLVIGQADFTSGTCNRGGAPSSITLCAPIGVSVDPAGNLYVSDRNNNRVLEFDAPFGGGGDTVADRVFGQPDFASVAPNQGGARSASTLWVPFMLQFRAGFLYVADPGNNRVLGYSNPLTDSVADLVIGQPDFATGTPGTTASAIRGISDVASDSSGRLYVNDIINNRVLVFSPPLSNGMAASVVLGQPDFTSNTANNGGLDAGSLNQPHGLSIDSADRPYVSEFTNHRVLTYDPPVASGQAADLVFGQADFTTATCNFGGTIGANTLCNPTGNFADANGNLWIVDSFNQRVLRFDVPVVVPTPTATVPGATPTGPTPTPSATPTPTVPLKICNGLPATIVGTSGNDLLIGTDGDDIIHGKGGNDEIKGRGGADILCGGSGDDVVRGGGDADFLKGGSGNDFLKGGGDRDVLVGNKGNDTLNGGDDDDKCIDGNGSNSFANCEDVDD